MFERIKSDGFLNDLEIKAFIHEALADEALDGKRVVFVIPDSTRSMPMPAVFRGICEATAGRTSKTDFLIALGTHPPMPDAAILKFLGLTAQERANTYGAIGIYNHEWNNPAALVEIGVLTGAKLAEISGGLMHSEAPVTINKR